MLLDIDKKFAFNIKDLKCVYETNSYHYGGSVYCCFRIQLKNDNYFDYRGSKEECEKWRQKVIDIYNRFGD